MVEVKPTEVKTITEMLEALHNWGINERDIIVLIQSRCKSPHPNRETIKDVIRALKHIEENIFLKIEKGRMSSM